MPSTPAALESVMANFDPTPFMRVGNPRRSSWTAGDEGALVFYYEAPSGRVFLIRTQAPWVIKQIQQRFGLLVDGRFGDITRRGIITGLRPDGVTLPDGEPATTRLLGLALLKALFANRGRVAFPARMEWPDPSRALLAVPSTSTYFAAIDILTGQAVPVESVTSAPAPPPGATPVNATGSTSSTYVPPVSPTPAATSTGAAVPPPPVPHASTGSTAATAPSCAPNCGAVPDVYQRGQVPSAPAPAGYAYVPTVGGPLVLMQVFQTINVATGSTPPAPPAGYQWTIEVGGQVVLVQLAAPVAGPQGVCPEGFVKGSPMGCKATVSTALPGWGGMTFGAFSAPVDAPRDYFKPLASKDEALNPAQRATAAELEAFVWAFPEKAAEVQTVIRDLATEKMKAEKRAPAAPGGVALTATVRVGG